MDTDSDTTIIDSGDLAVSSVQADYVQADYFGTDEIYAIVLPDKVSFIECKMLTEGDRRKYQSKVNRDVRLNRQSGDAILKMAAGEERAALLEAAIVGWNLKRNGVDVPFSKGSSGSNLSQFLDKASPKIIDFIYGEVAKKEDWLTGEASLEDIDAQIEALNEMRERKVKELEGNDS